MKPTPKEATTANIMPIDPGRYLVSFHPKQVSHRFADILILGSGLAGVRSALAVDPSRSVLIVTKAGAQKSNSSWAQGGIAAVWDDGDNFEAHAQDTATAGQGLCDPKIIQHVVTSAPECVRELIEWGAHFDEEIPGTVALTREGGHSASRILHALGDATGQEIMRTVLARAAQFPNIRLLENTFTIDLLTHEQRCVGALTWSAGAGIQMVWAKETILSTGGCGAIYRESTNPPIATGDGLAMAYRAGARLQDMEFMQFHPTVLYVAGSARHLISEALRGEGAHLLDSRGERFMPAYDSRAELAPRDVVAQAIVQQMAKTRHPCVYLDQRHLNAEQIHRRFPGISAACQSCGLDFARDLIPVRPGAHYMIGGVWTDEEGRTTLDGLWAAGEAAATGLHGANRLASNSLLEALVFGRSCGLGAARNVANQPTSYQILPLTSDRGKSAEIELDVSDIRNSLQSLMFRLVGIERNADGLDEAQSQVEFWSQYVTSNEFRQPIGWELQNMFTVAELMIRSARERTESRGTHFRTDFPETNDDQWRRHLAIQAGSPSFTKLPVTR